MLPCPDLLPHWQAVYATCKHGLRGWSLSCHEALRKYSVKVVVIEPGESLTYSLHSIGTCPGRDVAAFSQCCNRGLTSSGWCLGIPSLMSSPL